MCLLGGHVIARDRLDAQKDAFEETFVTAASKHGDNAEDLAGNQLYLAMSIVVVLAGGSEALAEIKDEIQHLVIGKLGSYQFAYQDELLRSCVAMNEAFMVHEEEEMAAAKAKEDSWDEMPGTDEEEND